MKDKLNRFDVELEQLTDGSIHAVVYGKRKLGAKKLGAFSGRSVDEAMDKIGRCIKAELNEVSETTQQEIEQ